MNPDPKAHESRMAELRKVLVRLAHPFRECLQLPDDSDIGLRHIVRETTTGYLMGAPRSEATYVGDGRWEVSPGCYVLWGAIGGTVHDWSDVPGGLADRALAYADRLHEQLEAEREKVVEWAATLAPGGVVLPKPSDPFEFAAARVAQLERQLAGEIAEHARHHEVEGQLEAKLQAAEGVVEAARSYRKIVSALATRLERDDGAGSEAWLALADAIAAYDSRDGAGGIDPRPSKP